MESQSQRSPQMRLFSLFFFVLLALLCLQSAVPVGRALRDWRQANFCTGKTLSVQTVDHMAVDLENKLADDILVQHPWQMKFVLLHKAYQRWGQGMNLTTALSGTVLDESEDVVVRRADGKLTYLMTDAEVSGTVASVTDFALDMEAEGRHFLLLETPNKTGTLAPEYEGVVEDYTVPREERVNAMLREAGVPFVSCSEKIAEEGIDLGSLFFKTDHHWTPLGGLWACKLFAEALNETAGYDIDTSIFDESQYDVQWRENFFLGSQGRKVTEVYIGPEDFPIVLPRYDTHLEVYHSSLNATLTGSLQETMMNWSVLETESLYKRNAYGLYGYGDEGLIQMHNLDQPDGHRICIVKISVADCMAPYLCNAAEYVDFIDLRLFGRSLREYIRETDPDTVAVIYQGTSFEDKNLDVLFSFD